MIHLSDATLNHLQEPVVGGFQNGTFELAAIAAEPILRNIDEYRETAACGGASTAMLTSASMQVQRYLSWERFVRHRHAHQILKLMRTDHVISRRLDLLQASMRVSVRPIDGLADEYSVDINHGREAVDAVPD